MIAWCLSDYKDGVGDAMGVDEVVFVGEQFRCLTLTSTAVPR